MEIRIAQPMNSNQPRQNEWPFAYECGCNLDTGVCDTHKPMMRAIRSAYETGPRELRATLFRMSDYPQMAGDWSAIRDSEPRTLEIMFRWLPAL